MERMPAHDQQKLDEFFALCSDYEGAYAHANLGFIAVHGPDGLQLAQGHVILPVGNQVPPRVEVQTPSICGCSVRLSELGVNSRDLVKALLDDGLETPVGKLIFGRHAGNTDAASVHLEQFPSNFYTPEVHPLRLTVSASSHLFTNRQAEFQSDLRAGVVPYDSLAELSFELGLLPLRWDTCSLSITAHTVVGVDLTRHVRNGVAQLAIRAARGVDVSHARLGYRIQDRTGRASARLSVEADALQWHDEDEYLRVGELTVPVPEGSVVQCFASYRGRWTHQGWISDPDNSANLRRLAHEVFDTNLDGIRRSLFDIKQLKQNARTLEAGVANLLFLHGFAVDPLSSQFMTEAADLLAFTPQGHIAVVECTVGAIDNDGKLSKLLARTVALSEKLKATGNAHLKCMPVVITTLPRDAITDLELAAEKGIVVLDVEDLQQALEETQVPREADRTFDRLWASVHSSQASLFPGDALPGQ
ncbi:hypothetical protein J2778_006184 [Paraburkholderia graminis]|uniref:hypothetical protein n=1 Tax=Paraburkholderia graminis TaxID=60548 RepID=UPI0028625C97|nr:hypothetical protein [Paraburkholderia graminis]MDR6478677.1 hypothetical protein [Paraburkholderia graminis]